MVSPCILFILYPHPYILGYLWMSTLPFFSTHLCIRPFFLFLTYKLFWNSGLFFFFSLSNEDSHPYVKFNWLGEGENEYSRGYQPDVIGESDRNTARLCVVKLGSLECLLPQGCMYSQSPKRYINWFWLHDSKAGAFQTVFKLMAATFGKESSCALGSLLKEISTTHQEDRMHARFSE